MDTRGAPNSCKVTLVTRFAGSYSFLLTLPPPRLTAIVGRPQFRTGRADLPALRVGELYAGDVTLQHNAVGRRPHACPMLAAIPRVIQRAAGTAGPDLK